MLLIIQYTFNPSSVQTTRPQSPNTSNLILAIGMQSGMHELGLVVGACVFFSVSDANDWTNRPVRRI